MRDMILKAQNFPGELSNVFTLLLRNLAARLHIFHRRFAMMDGLLAMQLQNLLD